MGKHVVAILAGVGAYLALGAGLAWADDLLASKEKFFTPHYGEQVPLDLKFVDETGKSVQLGDYVGQRRPIILVLAYFECPMLCKLVLKDLVDGLKGVEWRAGEEYEIVVVSFDPREKPDLAARHKAAYVEDYGRPGSESGWHFLTGDQANIDALTDAVGFRVMWDEKKQQYVHARGITILTPRGRIARYFVGGAFPPRDLRLALVEASEGEIGKPMDRILLMCFSYDPESGKYSVAILRVVRAGGILTMLGLGAFWARCWWRGRGLAKPQAAAPTEG
jgi:protein SCO1/2